jgi:molecular chaperone GrpE
MSFKHRKKGLKRDPIADLEEGVEMDEQGDPQELDQAQGADGGACGHDGLEAELEQARNEAAEHYDRLLRTQAELQNVLRRQERERLDRARYAGEAVVRDLLPVVDDLERALQHAGDEGGALGTGVELVFKSLLSVLARHGVERIEALGKPFDPNEHEAVAMVESLDVPDNTVVAEHRAGYRLGDRLLRPAMVAVARAPGQARA